MLRTKAPTLVVAAAAAALALHGPIAQPGGYHAFADGRAWAGIPNAADVLSNLGIALAGAWGCHRLLDPALRHRLGAALPGYALFLAALLLTALGSGYYHWAPDNARLVWDRLPIALACAGLLAGARAQTVAPRQPPWVTPAAAVAALAAVWWWAFTEARGVGDLRPYLLLQAAPLVVIPLWQWSAAAPRRERLAFAGAIALYVLAKLAELGDAWLFDALGAASGHTVKHLLAAAAGALLAWLACGGDRRAQ